MGGKGKSVAGPSSEGSDHSGSESDVPRARKSTTRKNTTKKRATKKQKQGEAPQPARQSKPTPAMRLRKMNAMKFEQTKWADHQLLHDLGIFDDVNAIFNNMGLGGLFNMEHVAYEHATKHFLATLSFYDDTALDITDENRGRLSFKIDGTTYNITMAQLGSLFHFPGGGEVSALRLDLNEAQGVWTSIAQGEYIKGVSKASSIRNPAIRYAHKFLAHTLFERRETGAVKEDELALLTEGIKPFLMTTTMGNEVIGQPQRLNLAHFLAIRFTSYQEWVWTNKDSKPQIGIGGLITPILLACGVVLPAVEQTPSIMRIDAQYLSVSKFLVGRVRRSYGYRFKLGNANKVIILPRQAITSLNDRDNVIFNPRPILLHDPTRDGQLTTIKRNQAAPQANEDVEEELPEPVYGSKRYHFEPYAEPISGEALRTAHEHIGLLQRFTRWQGKQIKKLVKKVKKQGKQIKKLLKEQRQEEEGTSMAMVLSDEAEPSSQGARQRRSKGKAPISPSSSGSGNYSYDMESSPSHSN